MSTRKGIGRDAGHFQGPVGVNSGVGGWCSCQDFWTPGVGSRFAPTLTTMEGVLATEHVPFVLDPKRVSCLVRGSSQKPEDEEVSEGRPSLHHPLEVPTVSTDYGGQRRILVPVVGRRRRPPARERRFEG